MSLVLILFFLAGRLCYAANLILPLVSRWEVTRLTYFLQNFLGFCCFKCRVWSLVRCSLGVFFGSAGGRPRCSNVEFVLERIRFTLSECGYVKSCVMNVWNKWTIFMLSFRAVFSIEFCFGRLPQMAAIEKIVQLLPISSISRPSLVGFGFEFNQSQGTKLHASKCFEEVPQKHFHFYVNYQHLQPVF